MTQIVAINILNNQNAELYSHRVQFVVKSAGITYYLSLFPPPERSDSSTAVRASDALSSARSCLNIY